MDVQRSQTDRLVVPGKAVLALDTSTEALAARLRAAAVVPSDRVVGAYHAMVLGAPGLAAAASGLVLPADAFGAGSRRVVAAARRAGLVCGARADTGQEPLTASGQVAVTTGLDGLGRRLAAARAGGAGFAVWSVCTPDRPGTSAWTAMTVNSQAAARFAHACQAAGLLPLVRVGFRTDPVARERRRATLAAALLSLCGHLEDLDVDPAATIVCLPGDVVFGGRPLVDGPLAAVSRRLGAVLTTPAAESPHSTPDVLGAAPFRAATYVGRTVTRPALDAWRGRPSAVPAGRRVLRERLGSATSGTRRIVEAVRP